MQEDSAKLLEEYKNENKNEPIVGQFESIKENYIIKCKND
jgi:hypothetical protein